MRHQPRWIKKFLKALTDSGIVSASAAAAGIARQTAYERRSADPAFRDAWEDALEDAADLMEEEARRRAVDGAERPVFYKGKQVGTVREYSDTLLIFLLKALRPEKYRDNYDLNRLARDLAAARRGAPRSVGT